MEPHKRSTRLWVRLIAVWIALWGLPPALVLVSLVGTWLSGGEAPAWFAFLALLPAGVFILVAAALFRFHPLGRLAGRGMLLLQMLAAGLLVFNTPDLRGVSLVVALLLAGVGVTGYYYLDRPQVKDLFLY